MRRRVRWESWVWRREERESRRVREREEDWERWERRVDISWGREGDGWWLKSQVWRGEGRRRGEERNASKIESSPATCSNELQPSSSELPFVSEYRRTLSPKPGPSCKNPPNTFLFVRFELSNTNQLK